MPECRESIVPRMYVALPKSGPADIELPEGDCPVMRPLIADLLVAYAYDMDSHYTLVPYRDLPKLGLTEDSLHDCAIANLRRIGCVMEAHGGDPIYMVTAGGNYEATLILLPEVCESLASMVSGRLIASVAARDLLFFTGDSDPEHVGCLRTVTSKVLETAEKPLSRHFIVWSGSNWAIHEGHAS